MFSFKIFFLYNYDAALFMLLLNWL